ncbi:MAG: hypothetical protein M0C28_07400 [Candidatus Moduliflexus flocculans]|nr:hypothetical protein [Candidatus Moduliflexus flocculans]
MSGSISIPGTDPHALIDSEATPPAPTKNYWPVYLDRSDPLVIRSRGAGRGPVRLARRRGLRPDRATRPERRTGAWASSSSTSPTPRSRSPWSLRRPRGPSRAG